MVLGSVYCFVAAAGLCLVAWRVGLLWGFPLVGAFLFVATNVEARADLVMDAGLLCWGLLCFVEFGRRLIGSAAAFVAFAAFSALAKSSELFMVGPILVLLAAPRSFCAGVDRAIKIVELALQRFGAPVYIRHEIVHNRHVVEELRAAGAVFVEELRRAATDVLPLTRRAKMLMLLQSAVSIITLTGIAGSAINILAGAN